MSHVTSKDGTSIAYDRQGHGPAVILVGGGLDDGSENAPLAAELAEHFTVYDYARSGRGQSGDTLPYAVEREIEDIEALIAETGGSAHLYGVSSGDMFALEAAAAGLAIGKLAVYDVPYDTADDAPQRYQQYREQLGGALAEGRRGDAVELFMRVAGASPPYSNASSINDPVRSGSAQPEHRMPGSLGQVPLEDRRGLRRLQLSDVERPSAPWIPQFPQRSTRSAPSCRVDWRWFAIDRHECLLEAPVNVSNFVRQAEER